jgi:hypothetical protein
MEDNSKRPMQRQGLPEDIPTTDEAERSELSERLDRQIIKDHLSDNDGITGAPELRGNQEPGAPS